jgi:hypothetical protein
VSFTAVLVLTPGSTTAVIVRNTLAGGRRPVALDSDLVCCCYRTGSPRNRRVARPAPGLDTLLSPAQVVRVRTIELDVTYGVATNNAVMLESRSVEVPVNIVQTRFTVVVEPAATVNARTAAYDV